MQRCDNTPAWCLDRRVNISTVLSVASSLVVAVAMITSLAARIDALEAKAGMLRDEVRESRRTVLQVERIDERIVAMQHVLEEIKAELRRRREGHS